METPDITPVQLKGFVSFIAQFAAIVGLNVGDELQTSITIVLAIVIAIVHAVVVLGDAIIRAARAKNVEAILRTREQYGPVADPFIPNRDVL